MKGTRLSAAGERVVAALFRVPDERGAARLRRVQNRGPHGCAQITHSAAGAVKSEVLVRTGLEERTQWRELPRAPPRSRRPDRTTKPLQGRKPTGDARRRSYGKRKGRRSLPLRHTPKTEGEHGASRHAAALCAAPYGASQRTLLTHRPLRNKRQGKRNSKRNRSSLDTPPSGGARPTARLDSREPARSERAFHGTSAAFPPTTPGISPTSRQSESNTAAKLEFDFKHHDKRSLCPGEPDHPTHSRYATVEHSTAAHTNCKNVKRTKRR